MFTQITVSIKNAILVFWVIFIPTIKSVKYFPEISIYFIKVLACLFASSYISLNNIVNLIIFKSLKYDTI